MLRQNQNLILAPLTTYAPGNYSLGPFQNPGAKGVLLYLYLSQLASGASLTATIQGQDPASQQWLNLLSSAALTAVGLTSLLVYPGVGATANQTANGVVPRSWRVLLAVASGNVQASVGGCLMV
jgi:hypothetical protein